MEGSGSLSLSLPYPWHESIWDNFNQDIEQDRLAHALMLNGPKGIGKVRLAMALAQRLLCTAEMSRYACGSCKSCQLLLAGNHPDLTVLEPEDDGKKILIEPVRKLCTLLSKTAQQGGWKVAVIIPAESMNISAANALLKSLEEPQGNTLLILVSDRPGMVSATIRSRCQKTNLALPDSRIANQWLGEITGNSEQSEATLALSAGRPLLALEYMQSDSLEIRRDFEATLDALRRGDISAVDAAQKCHKQNADIMLGCFMDYLHRIATGELKDNPNPWLFDFSDKLRTARSWVLSGSNPNLQLLWEELFMDWLQVFRRRR
ncbi:DNA polymerase III subunit delta' [SAR92 clade bacterium H921]|nr:DNA polymerase III subunit delta' [SAR92 clade bacterium H921]